MECLAGTRSLSSSSRWTILAKSHPPCASHIRQYASTPASRRTGAHHQSCTNDTHSYEEIASPSQSHPLSGYYSLILNTRSPYRGRIPTARPTRLHENKPTPASTAEPQSPQDKMSIVFGTRLAGPGRSSRYDPGEIPPESRWITVNGVPIPPRPEEPDNCCMSGCVHCVWDDFRDEMEHWAARIEQAKAKGGLKKGTKDMRTAHRAEVDSASQSMDDDGGGSETNWALPSQDEDLFANIPVGIREFMKTEKKLRAKHQQEHEQEQEQEASG